MKKYNYDLELIVQKLNAVNANGEQKTVTEVGREIGVFNKRTFKSKIDNLKKSGVLKKISTPDKWILTASKT